MKMFSNDRLHAPIPVRYSRHTYQKKRGAILKCLIPGSRSFSLQRLTSFIFYFFRAQTHRPPPPSNLFSIFFLKERPSNSWRHRLYPSSTIWFTKYKKKERSEKMFLSRDVRGQALEMQSGEIGNALSPSLVCTWKGLQVSTCLAPGRHAIGPTVI